MQNKDYVLTKLLKVINADSNTNDIIKAAYNEPNFAPFINTFYANGEPCENERY